LVEVMLALGLLLLGMTSILGLLSFGAALARTAELRASAAGAAQAVMADLEERLFPLVVDPSTGLEVVGEPQAITEREVPGHPGLAYSATATPEPADPPRPGPRRYRVDVEMRWSEGGRPRAESFTALLLGEVAFGERMRRLFVAGEGPVPADAVEPRPLAAEAAEMENP
jgi:hypothetical protein